MGKNAGTGPASAWLMRPAEAAAVFRVDPKTVVRWVKRGKIKSIKTQGGHHRFQSNVIVQALVDDGVDHAEAVKMVNSYRSEKAATTTTSTSEGNS